MNATTFTIIFASGLIVGITVLYITQRISSGENLDIVRAIGKLCSLVTGIFRRSSEANNNVQKNIADPTYQIDPREQNLYDSAQTIRSILLILATYIRRADKVATDSSLLLGDVKSAIKSVDLPTDLGEAHSLLMKEIDRVISSNVSLKVELAKSQEALTKQQHQIEDLRTAVRIDGLTQIANRTYFDEKLSEIIALRKRYGEPFSLLMIDIDNFKTINDVHGHPAGDRILKGVAIKIKASLRGSDFLARFGGDEYALILIKTDVKAATEVAWKLCEEVRGSRFILDNSSLTITLSIGLAEASDDDNDEMLLKRADAALYRAKADGRNGVAAS